MSPTISLLVPFRADRKASRRLETWRWLRNYWSHELPEAEIVIGRSRGRVFSKTQAVNHAAAAARGDIFVILDSDCYIPGSVIRDAALNIEIARQRGHSLWFVPYRRLYRLTQTASDAVLASRAGDPYRFPTPPDDEDVESTVGSMHGHHFGAMIQVMSREAFELIGGMDPRFKGWGGEDVAFVRALDTLFGKHKTTSNDVLHLWHPNIGATHKDRMWQHQRDPRANEQLAQRYNVATGDRARMRALVDEGFETGWLSRVTRWISHRIENML